MDFLEDLFVSFFSGLIPVLMKGGEKKTKTGIQINNNNNSKIKNTTVQGNVSISDNVGLEIDSGELNG